MAGGGKIRHVTCDILVITSIVLLGSCTLTGIRDDRVSECTRISDLSLAGEHKPAVDAADALDAEGRTCSEEILVQVSDSRKKLEKADAYVHKALQRRKEGNLLSAQANLVKALESYPRYYWAMKLLKDTRRSIANEVSSLENEAQYLENRGDPLGALSRLKEADKLSPGNQKLRSEIVRLQADVEQSREYIRIKHRVEEAEALLEQQKFEEAEKILLTEKESGVLPQSGEELLQLIKKRKSAIVQQRISVALESEQKGNLDVAAGHVSYLLDLVGDDEPHTAQTVELARLLGMKLYSAGELVQARDIWVKALNCDPGNEKLKKYIREVNMRLEKLEILKQDEKGP